MFTTVGRGVRRALGSKLTVAVAAGALGFGAAGTAVYADIPDGNGVINACYSGTGSLRVIDTAARPPRNKCFGTETALSWTAKGIAGPRGPAGAAGPPGPRGPAGAPGSSSGQDFYFKQFFGRVSCDGDDFATGGGASAPDLKTALKTSIPLFESGLIPDGWQGETVDGKPANVIVMCVRRK